jgi:hypothetical protein
VAAVISEFFQTGDNLKVVKAGKMAPYSGVDFLGCQLKRQRQRPATRVAGIAR